MRVYSRAMGNGSWTSVEDYLETPTVIGYTKLEGTFGHYLWTSGHWLGDWVAVGGWAYYQDWFGVEVGTVYFPSALPKPAPDYLGSDEGILGDSCGGGYIPIHFVFTQNEKDKKKIPDLPNDDWKKCLENARQKYCDTNKVSYWQLRCIIWAESGDNPKAVNPESGTSGLIQIHPCWFRIPRPPKRKQSFHCTDIIPNFDVFNPCDNITCGVYLFCKVHGSDPKKYGTGNSPKYKECMKQKH